MWSDVEACFDAARARLAEGGLVLAAKLEPGAGLMCSYANGSVSLALPTLEDAPGCLRATMIGAMMGATAAEVAWLFEALLPRLVGHEIGHALRDEARLLGDDVRNEEQIADRLGDLLCKETASSADLGRAKSFLGDVCGRLGGLDEAVALHRNADAATRLFGLRASPEVESRARLRLQRDYYRDVSGYLRLFVAWAFVDLSLDRRDNLDDFRRDHLFA